MSVERVFLIVLDSVGAGQAPDAEQFGDAGTSTLRSLHRTGKLNIPTLVSLGIGNIEGLEYLGRTDVPRARVALMREASAGKDTTIGHWEIAGHISDTPLPTFPDGFDDEIVEKLCRSWGRGMICNKPYSGTAVIDDYGEQHLESGKLIVYTSADSVLQIAAHTDLVPLEQLYEYCEQAREIMSGTRYGVGRIIARPFAGEVGNFYRTADRHDYSLKPPCALLPDAVMGSGMDTVAIGKISDIFASQGFTQSTYTHSNAEGMSVCSQMLEKDFRGLCFVNLVDFDMLWGHRRDALAYTQGLNDFDTWLSGFIGGMSESDVLIITADHGCDPSYLATTDHTRECTPCIIYGRAIEPGSIGHRDTFADIAATVAQLLGVDYECDGKSMI